MKLSFIMGTLSLTHNGHARNVVFQSALIIFLFCASALFSAQETDFSTNGAVLKEKKNGSEIWTKEDGTVITVYPDRSEAKLSNGSRIVKFNDGKREVYAADGAKIVIDDAKGIREYTNAGAKQKIDFQNRTPFGEKILRVEKKILKDPQILLIYLPEKSDEILYPEKSEEKIEWEIKAFFDGLYDAMRQKFINDAQSKKTYTGKPYNLEVSFCKYCKTGYCFGKPRQVTVEILEAGSLIKTFTLNGILLRDKEKRTEFIKEIIMFVETK